MYGEANVLNWKSFEPQSSGPLSSGAPIAGAQIAVLQRQGGDLGLGAAIAGAPRLPLCLRQGGDLGQAASGPSKFSNDSIDFLQNDFSNVFSNCLGHRYLRHIDRLTYPKGSIDFDNPKVTVIPPSSMVLFLKRA